MNRIRSLYLVVAVLSCLELVVCAPGFAAEGLAARRPAGPAWAWNLPVYETSLELATPNGKFQEFEERLDCLKDLGVGIIWFLPIFPRSGNPPDKPRSMSPYCVRDFYDVNPKHGAKEDFKHLVAAIHARGMYAMMDWVPNHTAWGNELIKTHPEYYKKDGQGHILQANGWKDVAQLDYTNRGLWEYMYQARRYWITQFDVDGFREDAVHLVPLEHWQWLRPKLDALKPVFMLAEADAPNLHPAFDMTYDWTSQAYFYMIGRGVWPASCLDRLLDNEKKLFPAGAIRMRHLTNHDLQHDRNVGAARRYMDKREAALLEKTSLAEKYEYGERCFALLCGTLPNGKPMVWNGQELGILSDTPKLHWKDCPSLVFYRALLHAYRENPALYRGAFGKIATVQPQAVYAFWRRAGQNRAVVVLNLCNRVQHETLDLGEVAGNYTEVFTGQKRTLAGKQVLDLEPWGYRLYLTGTPLTR